jgi:hypothetical protein
VPGASHRHVPDPHRNPSPACAQAARGGIVATLGVSIAKDGRLVDGAEQVRDLEQYKCDSIPVESIRELFGRRLEEDPALNQVQVARRARTDRMQLRRALGLLPSAGRIVGGQRRLGEICVELTVEMASRIVRALGVAPREIPGGSNPAFHRRCG